MNSTLEETTTTDHRPADTQNDGVRRRKPKAMAVTHTTPIEGLPRPIDNGGGDQSIYDTHTGVVASPLNHGPTIVTLRRLQRQRIDLLKSIIRGSNQVKAHYRTSIVEQRHGFGVPFNSLSESERSSIKREASSLVKKTTDAFKVAAKAGLFRNQPDKFALRDAIKDTVAAIPDVPEDLRPMSVRLAQFAYSFFESDLAFDRFRSSLEANMVSEAESLPVYPWIEAIKGAGALGLAVIVGEAGDIGTYSNPGKLRKRLGIAPPHCYAMETNQGKTVAAIPRRRRSACWTVADSLLKKDNIYSLMLKERRELIARNNPEFDNGIDPETGKRKLKAHGANRAKRWVEQQFIKHLWRAWCAAHKIPVSAPHPGDTN